MKPIQSNVKYKTNQVEETVEIQKALPYTVTPIRIETVDGKQRLTTVNNATLYVKNYSGYAHLTDLVFESTGTHWNKQGIQQLINYLIEKESAM